jgi:iron-sulfur cluster repair protein YtfE (RIC family)
MSLLRTGAKPPAEQTPASLILECHARIRSFAAIAVRLAGEDAPEAELCEAATGVHRYFTQALPRHVADEELSVAPRLRQFAPETGDALAAMEREHRAHEELLARLIPAWESLRADPGPRRFTLADATRLQAALEEHLAAEERLVVPALVRLPGAESDAIVEELRQRRR